MHDAYNALLETDDPHTRAIAANHLLKNVPIHSAQSFADAFAALSLNIELARLEKVLVDAFFLGRDALSGVLDSEAIPDFHTQNARWLTGTVERTNCMRNSAGGASTRSQAAQQFDNQPAQPSNTGRTKQRTAQASALFAAITALIIAGICYAIYHSRHFRIKRIERLPRHAVAFKASGEFNGQSRPIIVLDVSLGGAKIECDHPPLEKEALTLNLPCGTVPASIVWATAFYAGVMFEKQLTEEDLQSILDSDGVTTRSRLSNIY